jgi:hypothetical protein
MLAAMTSKGVVAGQHQEALVLSEFKIVLKSYEGDSRSGNSEKA